MEEGTNELDAGYAAIESPAEKPVEDVIVEEPKQVEPEPEKTEPVVEEQKPTVDPLAEMKAHLEQFEKRIRNAEGHIGGLNHNQKLLQETLQASKAAAQAVDDKPTQKQMSDAVGNPREWEDLKADFPEWAAATERFLEHKIGGKPSVDVDEIKRQVQSVRAETEASIRGEIIDSSLDAVFPGWKDEVKTPAFGGWLSTQSEDIQKLGASPRIGDAARLLRLYEKREVKSAPKPNIRQELIKAAVTPRGNGGSPTVRTDIDEFEAGYNSR